MKTILNAVVILIAVLIAWSLLKTALHFLWFPLMMVIVALVLLYLVLNQRK
jgi:predicted Co/Zn/Cd cation transporter (cation efflux family)